MIPTVELTDVIKSATALTSTSGKSLLMKDANGNLGSISPTSFMEVKSSNRPPSALPAGWIRILKLGEGELISFYGIIHIVTPWNTSVARFMSFYLGVCTANWDWDKTPVVVTEVLTWRLLTTWSGFSKCRIVIERNGNVGSVYLEVYTESGSATDTRMPSVKVETLIGSPTVMTAVAGSAPNPSLVREFTPSI